MFLRNSLSISSMSSTPCDEVVSQCLSMRPGLELHRYAPHQVTQKLKVKKFEFGLIVRIHLLLWVPGVLDRRSTRACRSVGPPTVEDMGKAHRIYEAMNNCQVEIQSNMLETSGIVTNQTLIILIDLGATESFI
jgi:hypothetical protein